MASEVLTLLPPTYYALGAGTSYNQTVRVPLARIDVAQAEEAILVFRIHAANWQGTQALGVDYQLCGYTEQDPIERWQGNPFVPLFTVPAGTAVPFLRTAALPSHLPSFIELFIRATQTSFGAVLDFQVSADFVVRGS